jgi:hypothetical protein
MLIGRSGRSLIERMLLKPSIVMDWIVSEAMAFPVSLTQRADALPASLPMIPHSS